MEIEEYLQIADKSKLYSQLYDIWYKLDDNAKFEIALNAIYLLDSKENTAEDFLNAIKEHNS